MGRLREADYGAHVRLGEWDGAIADATKLVELEPQRGAHYEQRGLAREAKKDLPGPIEDLQQAVDLDAAHTNAALHLADDYEKVGRPCDAIAPLELVAARRSGAPDIASFRQRIEMLYVLDACKPLRPTGKATIRFVPGRLATTKVVLNGKTSLQMVVDTGASYVTITRKTAERLGIDVAKLPKVQVATAAGVRTHSRGRLDEVKVQGLTAKNVDLTIADDLGGAEGLLGQSFLARFQITTDNTAGKLELTAR